MDDIDSKDFDTKDFGTEELDPLIVYGDSSAVAGEEEKPIPFDDGDSAGTSVSHAPLNLGGGSTTEIPEIEAAIPSKERVVTTERITGVRTFFTKLHPGAMEFLDEQITQWLRNNPNIVVKRTNVTTGEVQAKKTEPNIIVTIWY